MAPSYAPDLSIIGVIADAPVIDLENMFDTLVTTDTRGGIISLALMTADAWARVYPEIKLDQLLTSRGQRLVESVVRQFCLTPAFLLSQLAKPSDLIVPDAIERLQPIVHANTPGLGPYAMPVLIVQGEKDEIIPEETTRRITGEMCQAGTHLTYRSYPDAGHLEVITASHEDVLEWIDTVRSGEIPPSTCPQ